jgi:hypothetical protein
VAECFDQYHVLALGDFEEIVELGDGGARGLFEDDVFAGEEHAFGLFVVQDIGGGDVDCGNGRVLGQRIDGGVEGDFVRILIFRGEFLRCLVLARVHGTEIPF